MKAVNKVEITVTRGDWTFVVASEVEEDDLIPGELLATMLEGMATNAAAYLRSGALA